jgi:6-phosphogluconolactonase
VRTTPDPLPPEAPFERVTLPMAALTNAEMILVIRGPEKRALLEVCAAP